MSILHLKELYIENTENLLKKFKKIQKIFY